MAYNPTKKFRARITNVVRRYNASVTRNQKKGDYSLEKVSVSQILNAESRSTANTILKLMESTLKKGAKETVNKKYHSFKNYEVEQYKILQNKAKYILKKQIKDFQQKKVKIYGMETVITHDMLQDSQLSNLKAQLRKASKTLNKVKDTETYLNYLNRVIYRSENVNLGFKKSINEQLNLIFSAIGRTNDYNYVKAKLDLLDDYDFLDLYNNDLAIKQIIDTYIAVFGTSRTGKTSVTFQDGVSMMNELADNLVDSIDSIVNDYVKN